MKTNEARAYVTALLGSVDAPADGDDSVFPDAQAARQLMVPYVDFGRPAEFPLEESRPVVLDRPGEDAIVVVATVAWTWAGPDGSLLLVLGNWSTLADDCIIPFVFDAELLWGSDGVSARLERGMGTRAILPARAFAVFRLPAPSDMEDCGGCGGCGGTCDGCGDTCEGGCGGE